MDKKTNTLSDLVLDLFTHIKEKYGITDHHGARFNGNHEISQVIFLKPADHKFLWVTGMALVPSVSGTLDLHVYKYLDPSENSYSDKTPFLEVCSSWENGLPLLHIRSGEHLGGWSTMNFNNESEHNKIISGLRCEIINKTHELFYSGNYNAEGLVGGDRSVFA